jgi:branched-chain amino acid transport system permease protein
LTLAAREALPNGPPALLSAIFVASLVLGGLLAAGTGYLVGLPSLRLRGDYLAIVTLGFGEIIRVIILNVSSLGGARGLYGITGHATVFWVGLVVVVTIVALHRITRSDYGRTLLAIREDEVAAEAMGIDTTGKKVQAFAIAAFFAGVAGGLFAHTVNYLNPNSFTFVKSFDYVVMVILGGMGSLSGAIIAATGLTILLEILRPTTLASTMDSLHLTGAADWLRGHDFRISLYAAVLILMMLLRPNGLFGKRELWEIFRRKERPPAPAGS